MTFLLGKLWPVPFTHWDEQYSNTSLRVQWQDCTGQLCQCQENLQWKVRFSIFNMWQLDGLSAKSLWGHSSGHGVQRCMNCLVIDSEINSAASGGYITLLTHYCCSWMVKVDYWSCKWLHLTQQVDRAWHWYCQGVDLIAARDTRTENVCFCSYSEVI